MKKILANPKKTKNTYQAKNMYKVYKYIQILKISASCVQALK